MRVTDEQVNTVYEEFLERYQEQFIASDDDDILTSGLCGEAETTLAEAVWTAPGADIPLADDMIQKILSVLPPESDLGWAVRDWLREYRPDFIDQSLAA